MHLFEYRAQLGMGESAASCTLCFSFSLSVGSLCQMCCLANHGAGVQATEKYQQYLNIRAAGDVLERNVYFTEHVTLFCKNHVQEPHSFSKGE